MIFSRGLSFVDTARTDGTGKLLPGTIVLTTVVSDTLASFLEEMLQTSAVLLRWDAKRMGAATLRIQSNVSSWSGRRDLNLRRSTGVGACCRNPEPGFAGEGPRSRLVGTPGFEPGTSCTPSKKYQSLTATFTDNTRLNTTQIGRQLAPPARNQGQSSTFGLHLDSRNYHCLGTLDRYTAGTPPNFPEGDL